MLEKQVGRRIIVVAALMTAVTLAAVVAFQGGTRQSGTVPAATPPRPPLPSPVSTSVMVYQCDFTKAAVNIHAESPQPSAVVGEGNPGDGFLNLNSQGIYNYGTDIKTGVTGYVYFSYLTCGLVPARDDAAH